MSLDVYLTATRPTQVFSANITHNLNAMTEAAGIYHHVWRPEELGITAAGELIEPLRKGIARLEEAPQMFERYNPANGWGDYDGLVAWLKKYLAACEENPDATIYVSR